MLLDNLLLRVAIPSPLRLQFDYLLPASLNSASISPGIRVKVPFGSRELIAIVISLPKNSNVPPKKLKPILEILDKTPILDKFTLSLYLWSSRYYQYPIGLALQTSLPKAVKQGKPLIQKSLIHWRLTEKAKKNETESISRAPQQSNLVKLLHVYKSFSAEEASELLGVSSKGFLSSLAEKGLVKSFKFSQSSISQNPKNIYAESKPLTLNVHQKKAFDIIQACAGTFACYLLEGVTGSGKTEVYLHLIAEALLRGQQVLILIPEISLSPQTLMRFQKRFACAVAVLHSGLSDKDRFESWLKARNGQARIIIGTRSAIFTPMLNLGLIIVDEEHDDSYKQKDGFRYSARDLAVYRAKQLDIAIVLGSATPSLESLYKAMLSQYTLLKLPERAGTSVMPQYRLINMKGADIEEGFSSELLSSIKFHLENKNQVIIFINRRGYAPLIQCYSCGWTAICSRCEMGFTLHQQPALLRCHHCEAHERIPANCPECNSSQLIAIGLGTERSEKVLTNLFPETPIIRIDRDTTRRTGSMSGFIETINIGLPCILIGTQMLAKGHHFPQVTLVAILDADTGLFSADFRGQEKMGQLFTQVSGRAGRGEVPGEVLIQTYHANHPTLELLVNNTYSIFAKHQLENRAQANLPPYSFQILFRAEAHIRNLPEDFLKSLRQLIILINIDGITLLGPFPSAIEKRAGKFRFQLLLQSNERPLLHKLCVHILYNVSSLPLSKVVKWSIDVDPLDFT